MSRNDPPVHRRIKRTQPSTSSDAVLEAKIAFLEKQVAELREVVSKQEDILVEYSQMLHYEGENIRQLTTTMREDARLLRDFRYLIAQPTGVMYSTSAPSNTAELCAALAGLIGQMENNARNNGMF